MVAVTALAAAVTAAVAAAVTAAVALSMFRAIRKSAIIFYYLKKIY